MSISNPVVRVFLLFIVVATGCSSELAPDVVQNSQEALDKARAMISENGTSEETLALLESAVVDPGLDADQYVEAVLLRARCYAESGDLEKAEADVQEAELGDPGEALLHFTKAIVYDRQGKAKESKKEFAIARRLDSSLKMPKY